MIVQLRGWVTNSGIDRKFSFAYFGTNMGFQDDALLRFCVGFPMHRQLRTTNSFRLLLVPSLFFHMRYVSYESEHKCRHSSSVAEVVRNPKGVKSCGTMVRLGNGPNIP